MKRALSLIIVLAMVLCMIPFSAFAAPEWNVGGTDFIDGGNYALLEENNFIIEELLWIAEESGTVMGINFTPYVEEVAEGEEGEDYSGVTVFAEVEGVNITAEGFEGYSVVAGEAYEISLYTSDVDWKGTATINLVGLEGSQSNPYVIANPNVAPEMGVEAIDTVTVPAGETVFCKLQWFGGETVNVSGEGVKIVMGEDVLGSINGEDGNPVLTNTVDLEIAEGMNAVEIKLTNKTEQDQTYTFTMVEVEVPLGTEENPEVIVSGTEYTATIAAAGTAYWYKYIAEGDGYISVSVDAGDLGWMYQVDNKSVEVGGMGDTQWSDSDPVVNPQVIAVSEGDDIRIMAATYDPSAWELPAGTVTVKVEFSVEEPTEPSEPSEPTDPSDPSDPEEPAGPIVIESLPYTHPETFSGEYNQEFTYTNNSEESYYLFVKADNGGFANLQYIWMGVFEYQGGIVYKMSPGESVTIIAYSYDSELGANTYTFSRIDEIEADGSYNFTYEWGSVLEGVTSHINETDSTVFYTYTAEKDGKLDCSAWWSPMTVMAGEPVMIEMEAGTTATLNYMTPIATIDEAEYYSIDEAVEAAVNGDEIVLVADATSETGITLFAGVTLNLNGNNLSTPYIAALNGNFVVGAAGATINTTNMMAAELINIDGVDYEWVAGDGVYTLTAVGVEPVADPVAKIGDTPYATVEDALNAAKSGETVTMIADDLNNADAILTIKGGVTLDLVAFDLKAAYVIGLTDSVVTGSRLSSSKDYAKLYVDSSKISISNDTIYTQTASNGVDYHLITLKMGDYYVFTHTQLYDSAAEGDFGFTADKEAGTASITFYFNLPGVAKTPIAADGASAHGVSFIVEATWTAPTAYGDMYQSMTYSCSEELAKALASGSILACPIDNCNNYQDLKLTTKLVTDTGTVVVGETYTY